MTFFIVTDNNRPDITLDCPTLKPGEGALESNRDTAFGTTVTFTCPVGQEFATGKSKITTECLIGGNWSISYIPKCQGKSDRYSLCVLNTVDLS